jgi:hypothetical protein
MFHRQKRFARAKALAARRGDGRRPRTREECAGRLLLPSALLVTIQAQLLAPFVLVDLCLAAFFD